MIGRTKLLAALLALVATAETAAAQRLSFSYNHRSPRVSLTYGNPYASRARTCVQLPRRVWVPGHKERVQRRVWVDGGYRRQWVPPVYERQLQSCGRVETVLVRPGRWALVEQPGRFETRTVEIWVDGYWKVVGR